MKTKEKSTWLSYMNTLRGSSLGSEELNLTGFNDFLNLNNYASSFFQHSIPFVYLLDYRSGSYLSMSDNFAGYKSECFLNEGIAFTLDIYQKDYLKVYNEEIFPDRLEILKSIDWNNYMNHVFSYNLMIKKKNGDYDHYLQRSCFLCNETGMPVFSMGTLTSISNYNMTNQIYQSIDRINKEEGGCLESIFKRTYYLHEEDRLFSKREKEVLLWMAEGLSSKMIADKLYVSEHTIINHRRNMQDKANMPNATALVSFAIKNGVI